MTGVISSFHGCLPHLLRLLYSMPGLSLQPHDDALFTLLGLKYQILNHSCTDIPSSWSVSDTQAWPHVWTLIHSMRALTSHTRPDSHVDSILVLLRLSPHGTVLCMDSLSSCLGSNMSYLAALHVDSYLVLSNLMALRTEFLRKRRKGEEEEQGFVSWFKWAKGGSVRVNSSQQWHKHIICPLLSEFIPTTFL